MLYAVAEAYSFSQFSEFNMNAVWASDVVLETKVLSRGARRANKC